MKYYIVDAFTDAVFKGNQAGVCLADNWPSDQLMQDIAMENNLAETAFVVPEANGFGLRWFTPTTEIDLCGHATLAAALVITMTQGDKPGALRFNTKSGALTVTHHNGVYAMDFPARAPVRTELTPAMHAAFGAEFLEAWLARDLLLIAKDEKTVRELAPDMRRISGLPGFGVIVSARGGAVDFVSRFFAPNAGVPEDPVTGSSHATLAPYWAERLGKKEMTALQLSARGGKLLCRHEGTRVIISGKAVLYLEGEIKI